MPRVKGIVSAVLLVAACGRVEHERTATLDAGEGGRSEDAAGDGFGGAGGLPDGDAARTEDARPPGALLDADPPVSDAALSDATTPEAGTVARHYDVFLDPPATADCEFAIGQERLNLSLYEGEPLRAYYFEDFGWTAPDAVVVAEGAVLEVIPDGRGTDETRPNLLLHWNGVEPTGSGTALAPLTCADGTTRSEQVGVHVSADVTPPRVRANQHPEVAMAFPFSWFTFMVSEPEDVANPVGLVTYPFHTVEDAVGRVTLTDDAGVALPVEIKSWPFGPAAAAVFSDPDAVAGRVARVGLSAELYDGAGNRAVADETPFLIRDVGPAVDRHDFDLGAQGMVALPIGDATVHEPGASGSPCESGGCLELRPPLGTCDDGTDPTAAIAFRVAVPAQGAWQMRYRVWTGSSLATPHIAVWDGPCGMFVFDPALTALSSPDGPYTHATEWTTDALGSCLGPRLDEGLILALCSDATPEDLDLRMVVEWIEAVP